MAGFPLPPGLAVSCSLPECERLREEGAYAKGNGRCLEIFGAWTCGTGHLFGDMGSSWEAESLFLEGDLGSYGEMKLVEG